MAFHRETAKMSAQQAIYDAGKWLLGYVLWGQAAPAVADKTASAGVPRGWAVAGMLVIPVVVTFLVYWWRRKPTDELTIHEAVYGAESRWTDVKLGLLGYMRNNRILGVPVEHATFKVPDPFYGQEKFLKVTYSIGNGRRIEVVRHEHDTISIPDTTTDQAALTARSMSHLRPRVSASPYAPQIRELADLVRFGTDTLLNADLGPNQTTWSVPLLQQRSTQWRDDVVAVLNRTNATETEKLDFEKLVTFQPKGIPGVDVEHARIREVLAERIHRLKEIIKRLESSDVVGG